MDNHARRTGTTRATYAGTDLAAIFRSDDGGESWHELVGLQHHPSREHWAPGAGGMCLHTILPHPTDPERMWVGMSAVGVFETTDGGATWQTRHDGLKEVETGLPESEVARCVHGVMAHPDDPERLFLQFHFGVFRSDNGGQVWKPIDTGLPSDFGFPIVVTRSGAVMVVPLAADVQRVFVDGRLRIFRSTDGGTSWNAITAGLPQEHYYGGLARVHANRPGDRRGGVRDQPWRGVPLRRRGSDVDAPAGQADPDHVRDAGVTMRRVKRILVWLGGGEWHA